MSLTRKSRWWGWRGGGRSPRERGASPSPPHLITPSNRSPITFPLSAMRTDGSSKIATMAFVSSPVPGCKDESTANRREFTSTSSSVSNAPRGRISARKPTHCPSTARLRYRVVQQNSTLQRKSSSAKRRWYLLKSSLIRRTFFAFFPVEQIFWRLIQKRWRTMIIARRKIYVRSSSFLIVASIEELFLTLRLSTP